MLMRGPLRTTLLSILSSRPHTTAADYYKISSEKESNRLRVRRRPPSTSFSRRVRHTSAPGDSRGHFIENVEGFTHTRLRYPNSREGRAVVALDAMNYYVVLGIEEGADRETIRSAFRGLVRRYHPDVGVAASPD